MLASLISTFYLTLITLTSTLNEPLKIPEIIDLRNNNPPFVLTLRPHNITIIDYDKNIKIKMLTRAYCWDSVKYGRHYCDIPGPTWIMQAGKTSNVTLENRLKGVGLGTDPPGNSNGFEKYDVSNLHTHGLHDDPNEDNIFNRWVNPFCSSNNNCTGLFDCNCDSMHSQKYNYVIKDIHYPGSHWYHAHWPGSVAYQVGGGLYGIIRMYPRDDLVSQEPTFSGDFDILSSWAWFTDTINCSAVHNTSIGKELRGKKPLNFPIMSLCRLWLFANSDDTAKSGTPYQQEITFLLDGSKYNNDVQRFLVNGQINPYINISTYHWYRLRIFWLMANDGVYFSDNSRNLNGDPYNGTTVIVPGSRADIAVNCKIPGTYTIHSVSSERGLDLIPVPRTGGKLLTLNVMVNKTKYNGTYNANFPFLSYNHSPYLTDTLNSDTTLTDITSKCTTDDFTKPKLINDTNHIIGFQQPLTQCNLALSRRCLPVGAGTSGAGLCRMSVNQISFHGDPNIRLMKINSNGTHEWSITSNFHPFHHHTWPFQIQRNVVGGWMAQRGDWRDTVGAAQSYIARVNYIDYLEGALIVHCHFVPHEDNGMMAKIALIPPTEPLNTTKIIPKNTQNITKRTFAPDKKLNSTQCLNLINKHSISCMNIEDINTKIILNLKTTFDSVKNECILNIHTAIEVRHGTPQNFWYSFGFGGKYSDSNNFTKGFDNTEMHGFVLTFQYDLFDLNNIKLNTLQSNMERNTFYVDISNVTYINCNETMNTIIKGKTHIGTLCTRVIHNFDKELIYLMRARQNETFIWAYGEGAYTKFSMHSARNPCGVIWNTGDVNENTKVINCTQKEGTLGHSVNRIIGPENECSDIILAFDLYNKLNGQRIIDCRINNPCQNNGICSDNSDTLSCDCSNTNYVGEFCQILPEVTILWSLTKGNQNENVIYVGDTVKWLWDDNRPHTVRSLGREFFPGYNTVTTQRGFIYYHTFNEPGLYNYDCSIHPSMIGTIRVYPTVNQTLGEGCCLKNPRAKIGDIKCQFLRPGLSLRKKKSCDSYRQCFWCDPLIPSSVCDLETYKRCNKIMSKIEIFYVYCFSVLLCNTNLNI